MSDTGNLSLLKAGRHTVSSAGDDADTVVLVNGALVNITSVLQNLSKSEDERKQMENELNNMEQERGMYYSTRYQRLFTAYCPLLKWIHVLHLQLSRKCKEQIAFCGILYRAECFVVWPSEQ